MDNLNLLFNKTYYEKLGVLQGADLDKNLNDKNSKLFRTVFKPEDYKEWTISEDDEKFRLMTTYPGLLIGTGNPHGSRMSNEDISVGFSFDYVTGQPFIPGSSVKGALRDYFDKKIPGKRQALIQILQSIDGNDYSDKIDQIEEEIFDGNDVFFDAVVARGGKYGEIVGPDYITPHKSPTANPIPISLIKIIPEVVFEFRFKLKDEGILNRKTKLKLFEELFKLFGVGAKTNVGYGRLVKVEDLKEEFKQSRPQETVNQGGKPRQNTQEKVPCPACGFKNFKYSKSGKLNTNCFKCRAKL